MEKKDTVYILNVDEYGKKIYTLESDPSQRFILDESGDLVPSDTTIKMELPELDITGNENKNEHVLDNDNENIIAQLEGRDDLEIIDPNIVPQFNDDSLTTDMEHADFEMDDPLSMEELSEGVGELDGDSVVEPEDVLIMHMDIRDPLSHLRSHLEQRIGINLSNYEFWLQDSQRLESHKNLVDQCVSGEGLVQVNVQVKPDTKCINIVDVLKPAEEYVEMAENYEAEVLESETEEKQVKKPQSIKRWTIDTQFKKDQERLNIPSNPSFWTVAHVKHWLQWAVRQFNLTNIKLSDWLMTGQQLCNLSLQEFQKKVPNDPSDVFWTHLELLKKCKLVAVLQPDTIDSSGSAMIPKKAIRFRKSPILGVPLSMMEASGYGSGNRTGNNGQIQLWQFLLELLTDKTKRNVIQWLGQEGEFKLLNPEVVAQLWGERKNKPTMNYEKLSRALRYYYDGDMISKVHGKRFVYKFVCDLKQLLGYSASELAKLVEACEKQSKKNM